MKAGRVRIQSADGKTSQEVPLPRGLVQARSVELVFINADDLTRLLDTPHDDAHFLSERRK
jgi:hypothetical protein